MKKYLLCILVMMLMYGTYDYLFLYKGDLYNPYRGELSSFTDAKEEKLWIDEGNGMEIFDIRGVNLGLGKPGEYATEYSIEKEEYLRWFQQIQDMGANVIRVYTLAHETFYEAFYEYNVNNDNPLYLIHGVWVDDYLINSSYSALDEEFYSPFLEDCKDVVDVIHGRHKSNQLEGMSTQHYKKDISQWVYGYILGIEWEDTLVFYTDTALDQRPQYQGEYFYTEEASNFEIFLAMIGDEVAQYESDKYGEQRAIAFSNWATTDPFVYPEKVKDQFRKAGIVDVEHIKPTSAFISGYFASYHIYPYYPDYYSYYQSPPENTYLHYLERLNAHHTIPVVISEFGAPSSRGMAAIESSLGRNQGFMSEKEQGEAIVSMYNDIKQAGSAGGIVFTWQDEWFKRTWNTMAGIDLDATPYWSDYQTNEQYFGLLSFDPGKNKSVCYVDGNKDEWLETDILTNQDGLDLSMKYDEKFIYFLAEQDNFNIHSNSLYIPIDTTPKSGTSFAETLALSVSKDADFIIEINGIGNSRVLVHERYNTNIALFGSKILPQYNPYNHIPDIDSNEFQPIIMTISQMNYYRNGDLIPFHEYDDSRKYEEALLKTYETGKLTYGNANPNSPEFNSLADFCAGDGFVEIKIPWSLLNFADPSQMNIHDDYYANYGVEYLHIDSMHVGLGDGTNVVQMEEFPLEKLGRSPEYHERLKESYYIVQEHWNSSINSTS